MAPTTYFLYNSFNLPYQQTTPNWVKFYSAFLPWGGFHTFSKLIQTSSTCQSDQFSLGERKEGWLFGRADAGGQSKNLANPSKPLASGGKNLVNLAMITGGRAKKGLPSAKYYSSPPQVLLLALHTACVTLSSHTEDLVSPLIFLSIFFLKSFLDNCFVWRTQCHDLGKGEAIFCNENIWEMVEANVIRPAASRLLGMAEHINEVFLSTWKVLVHNVRLCIYLCVCIFEATACLPIWGCFAWRTPTPPDWHQA